MREDRRQRSSFILSYETFIPSSLHPSSSENLVSFTKELNLFVVANRLILLIDTIAICHRIPRAAKSHQLKAGSP